MQQLQTQSKLFERVLVRSTHSFSNVCISSILLSTYVENLLIPLPHFFQQSLIYLYELESFMQLQLHRFILQSNFIQCLDKNIENLFSYEWYCSFKISSVFYRSLPPGRIGSSVCDSLLVLWRLLNILFMRIIYFEKSLFYFVCLNLHPINLNY